MTDWKPSSGIVYTDELRDIITSEKSVAVLAGAGAGKTELLAQKADYLFVTNKCPWPKRILSLTFKKEAQVNIKKRVDKRCGDKSSRFDSFTFHAFCKSIVDRFKNALPVEVRPRDNYDIVFRTQEANGQDKILMDGVIDLAIAILNQNSDIKKVFCNSYSYVFADEFQDTTGKQYELISTIFKGTDTKVLAVGDINQSIMLWAGASSTVFQDYINEFSASYKFLVTNYRSSQDIQRLLSIFLKFIDGSDDIDNASTVSSGCSINIYNNEHQESESISEKIRNLIESGVNESDICVLTKQQSPIYTNILRDSLTKYGINNLDMTDLQDALKEPVGEIFSLFIKSILCPSPKITTQLHDLYLRLNKVEIGDDKEEDLSSNLSKFIQSKQTLVHASITVDEVLSHVNEFITYIGVDKIKGRWRQYKSPDYYVGLWNTLENHLRNVFLKSKSAAEASILFTADNAVQIMNIHKCKGLEYHAVFFVGLEDQAFWSYNSARFENNCAIYVALSRAKEYLHISYSLRREHRMNGVYDNRPSSCGALQEVYNILTENCKLPVNNFNK